MKIYVLWFIYDVGVKSYHGSLRCKTAPAILHDIATECSTGAFACMLRHRNRWLNRRYFQHGNIHWMFP